MEWQEAIRDTKSEKIRRHSVPDHKPRSPRFNTQDEDTKTKRISLQFSEKRAAEQRNGAASLLDRIDSTAPTTRRNSSIIFNTKQLVKMIMQEEQVNANKICGEAYQSWKQLKKKEIDLINAIGYSKEELSDPVVVDKLKRLVGMCKTPFTIEYGTIKTSVQDPGADYAIKETLNMLLKYNDMGIVQFADGDVNVSLQEILSVMYSTRFCRGVLENNHALHQQFATIDFQLKDYRAVFDEAFLLLRLLKKNRESIQKIINFLGKQQATAIKEFSFVPFVNGMGSEDIFRSGIIKEKDIAPFFQRLMIKRIGSLEPEYVKQQMVELIQHPDVPTMVYGPVMLPINTITRKEFYGPLKTIVRSLAYADGKLELIENDEEVLKLNMRINPMGRIKERLQIALEELILRMASPTDQVRYKEILMDAFPSAHLQKARSWTKAFDLLTEIAHGLPMSSI